MTTFQNDDKEFNAAIEEARRTLDQFIAQLKNPKQTQTFFSLKARFEVGEGKGEHLWLEEVRYDGVMFTGKVGNQPKNLKDIKPGMTCTATRDQVTDWMIVEDGRLVGGTTIRLARSRKSEAERIEFDRHVGFRFN